ncbi:MAG: TIGR01440 family protein [Eubacteriales bacterium]|nr:TIGR01440 family protein [Eubacteriales bacterium]
MNKDSHVSLSMQAAEELIRKSQVARGEVFVLGLSTSEVKGENIGTAGSMVIGRGIVSAVHEVCRKYGLFLAVQGCEHINRALVVERALLQKDHRLVEVTVQPSLKAGGAAATAAFETFIDPACVEHIHAKIGMDVGDTEIGMHVQHVQVPVRLNVWKIGVARVTALNSRPKLIGGERSIYPEKKEVDLTSGED